MGITYSPDYKSSPMNCDCGHKIMAHAHRTDRPESERFSCLFCPCSQFSPTPPDMKHDEKPEPHSTFPLEQLKETFTTAYGPHPDVVDWKKDLGDLFLAARNKTSEEEPVALVIFAAVELVDRLLQAQKDEIREDEIAFLKRAKLECDVIVCDCGEPYKDSDLAKIITDRLSTLKPHD